MQYNAKLSSNFNQILVKVFFPIGPLNPKTSFWWHMQSCKKICLSGIRSLKKKKCPNLVFAEFSHDTTHKIKQMLVFFSIFSIWS